MTFSFQNILITLLIFLISKDITLLLYLHVHSYNLNDAIYPITSWDNEYKKAKAPLMSFRSLDINHIRYFANPLTSWILAMVLLLFKFKHKNAQVTIPLIMRTFFLETICHMVVALKNSLALVKYVNLDHTDITIVFLPNKISG